MIFQIATHWLLLKHVAQTVGSSDWKIEQTCSKELLTFNNTLYWVIYTEIIQVAFFVMELQFLSMTKKENAQFSSQEIQKTVGVGEREREREKGVGKGESKHEY